MRGPSHILCQAQRQEKGPDEMLQAIYRMMGSKIRRRFCNGFW
jgi:hypothetical protein